MLKKIWINVWKWTMNPNKKILLYDYQIPFNQSPTFSKEWIIDFSFEATNPLEYPIPLDQELFYAFHSTSFPYELIDIYPVINSLQTKKNGTYFIAYTTPIKGLIELPWNSIYVDRIITSGDTSNDTSNKD